jgi:hypothetical protein
MSSMDYISAFLRVTSASLYADIVADFMAQRTESMQVSIDGMKPAILRVGLRRALSGGHGVKMTQRGEETYLVRHTAD